MHKRQHFRNRRLTTFHASLGFTLMALSFPSHAWVNCPESTVKYVQPDTDRVYVQLEGQNWQSLGLYSQPGTSEKMSVALTAMASGKMVILRFPDGHDASCSTSATAAALMIRIEG